MKVLFQPEDQAISLDLMTDENGSSLLSSVIFSEEYFKELMIKKAVDMILFLLAFKPMTSKTLGCYLNQSLVMYDGKRGIASCSHWLMSN